MNLKKFFFIALIMFFGLSTYLFGQDKEKKNFLYKNIYKGEMLSEIKQKYPNSYFVDVKTKNLINNLFQLNFLKKLNFIRINQEIILGINPYRENKVVNVIILKNKGNEEFQKFLKKIVVKNQMNFKFAKLFYTNGIEYQEKIFKKEINLHIYLNKLNISLILAKKSLLYIFENYENSKNKKGVIYSKLETFKQDKNCKMCAYLGNKNIIHSKTQGIIIYKRN